MMHGLFYWQRFKAVKESKNHTIKGGEKKKKTSIKEPASLELNGTGLLSTEPKLMGLSHCSIIHGENIAPVSDTKSH